MPRRLCNHGCHCRQGKLEIPCIRSLFSSENASKEADSPVLISLPLLAVRWCLLSPLRTFFRVVGNKGPIAGLDGKTDYAMIMIGGAGDGMLT